VLKVNVIVSSIIGWKLKVVERGYSILNYFGAEIKNGLNPQYTTLVVYFPN